MTDPTILDTARAALEATDGDFAQARQIMLTRAKADQNFCNLLVGPVIGPLIKKLCEEALREARVTMRSLPPALDRGGSISTLNLSNRAANCLAEDNVTTVEALLQMTEGELLRTPNLGRVSLNEIKNALAERGMTLAGTPAERFPYAFRLILG